MSETRAVCKKGISMRWRKYQSRDASEGSFDNNILVIRASCTTFAPIFTVYGKSHQPVLSIFIDSFHNDAKVRFAEIFTQLDMR